MAKSTSQKPYEVLNKIKQGQIDRMYVLHGAEPFLVDEIVDLLLANLVDPGTAAFNLDVFNGKNADVKSIGSILPSMPMMGEHRVVVVRQIDQMKKTDRDLLIPYVEKPPSSAYQIYTAEKLNGREKFYATAKKTATMVSCDPLYENKIPQWIKTRFKIIDKQIDPIAVDKLHQSVGTNLYDLANEIEKLDIYTQDRNLITVKDVEFIVGSWRVNTVFELQKKIGARQTGDALVLVRKILSNGEPPLKIVAFLTYFFTSLLKVKILRQKKMDSRSIAGQAGMNPFFVDEAIKQADRYKESELERNFSLLYEIDLQLKTSAGVPEALMERLVFQLCDS